MSPEEMQEEVFNERLPDENAGGRLSSAALQKLDLAMENQQLTAIEFLAHVTAREAAVGRYKLMRDVRHR